MIYKILILLGGAVLAVYLLFPSYLDAILGKTDFKNTLKSGGEVLAVFDRTGGKFDDSEYTGDPVTDPLGPVKGGEAYIIKLSGENNWLATGLNQSSGKTDTVVSTLGNVDPSEGRLVIFDRIFTFDNNGKIIDSSYGVVGHLEKVSLINRVKNMIGEIGPRWVKIDGNWMDNNCFNYCSKIGKSCMSDSCPKGPPPCDCIGGTCSTDRAEKLYCAEKHDTDCRTIINKDTLRNDFFCCCR